jgi:acylglycerol lipase
MKHFETSWQTIDGLLLYAQGWEPETEPVAVVCLVHGLGEHSGRYAHLAAFLNQSGYSVMSFDLRGHGKSGGARGHSPSFEYFMNDIDLLMQAALSQYPGKTRFLYGHSLGGILVLNYALRRKPQVAGVIATGAGLRTVLEEQTAKVAFAKSVGAVLPRLSLPSGLDATMISHDPEVVRVYQSDPLVHDRATLGMAKNTFQAISWAFDHCSEFDIPLLLMHGTDDQIAYARGSQEFAGLVGCDCTLKLWDGLYHEIHNEPEKDQVFAFMLKWMEERRLQ